MELLLVVLFLLLFVSVAVFAFGTVFRQTADHKWNALDDFELARTLQKHDHF